MNWHVRPIYLACARIGYRVQRCRAGRLEVGGEFYSDLCGGEAVARTAAGRRALRLEAGK